MHVPHLHDWPATEDEAVALQQALAPRVDTSAPLGHFDFIAGCDIAYHLTEPRLFAAVVVLRAADLAVVEERAVTREVSFPYVPGLLSFREVPALLDALGQLRHTPDAVMLDGQGVAHPRRFGLACHLGLWLGLPCVGYARNWLVGDYHKPGVRRVGVGARNRSSPTRRNWRFRRPPPQGGKSRHSRRTAPLQPDPI